jgi:protease I
VNREQLKGRRIAVLAADGYEKVELTIPVAALKSAGADVDIISLRRGSIRGVNMHEPADRVHVDKTVDRANPSDYDALLIPGGYINPDLLRQSAKARAFVRAFDRAQKPIASLCHGPWVLASAGLLNGRVLTSWAGIRDDVVNAGGTWLDEEFVQDGNLATSRGPQDMAPFVRGILQHFAKGASMSRRQTRMVRSSPQPSQPPQVVIGAMKWMPKPSIRTALTLGAIGAGIYAMRNREPFSSWQRQFANRAA